MSTQWYKNAIIYELDVRTFFDADGDGFGDFEGLTRKLDYLAALGVTTVWLLPFFESPLDDGGYDVSDHYEVDTRVGSGGDFVRFLEQASDRGIGVIADLVVNHTSDRHPWFERARSSRDTLFHDYYIWSEEIPEDSPSRIVFRGEDRSPWTWNDATGQYYLHRFFESEPDLNVANPNVDDEIRKILGFWLRLGVAGFRIDAAPYIAEKAAAREGIDGPHDYLRQLRTFLSGRRPDAVFMAEADVEEEELGDYFGKGDEMNLLLNFLLASNVFLALARGNARSLAETLQGLPRPPLQGAYANFLRNHDELDLERLSPEEQQEVYRAFAPEESMRIFGRGIRRRPAAMLNGDQRRIRLATSLQFSLPGAPVLRYGDEIGMGDDLSLDGRWAVRTPMQWSDERNGGFSTASSEDLYVPVLQEGAFGAPEVNVADQWPRPDSLLNWHQRLIAARKQSRAVGMGDWEVVDTGDDRVLGMRYDHEGEVLFTLHNLSPDAARVKIPGLGGLAFAHQIFGDRHYGDVGVHEPEVELEGSGYLWLTGRGSEMPGAGDASA